jgi:hypothetical protein
MNRISGIYWIIPAHFPINPVDPVNPVHPVKKWGTLQNAGG